MGFAPALPITGPVGNSTLRVVAGAQACIAFNQNGTSSDVTDYRTDGTGACSFRIVSSSGGLFDVSFSYPFVDISGLVVTPRAKRPDECDDRKPNRPPHPITQFAIFSSDAE